MLQIPCSPILHHGSFVTVSTLRPPLLFPRGFPFPRLISFTLSLLFHSSFTETRLFGEDINCFFCKFLLNLNPTLGIYRISLAEIPNKESGSIRITYYGKFKLNVFEYIMHTWNLWPQQYALIKFNWSHKCVWRSYVITLVSHSKKLYKSVVNPLLVNHLFQFNFH